VSGEKKAEGMSVLVCCRFLFRYIPQRLPCGALAVGDAAASYPSNPAIPKNETI
jgi:hypothetical protein